MLAEVIRFISRNKEEVIDTYQDSTKSEANQITLKTKKELEQKYNWWTYLQIKDLFSSDKKNMDLGNKTSGSHFVRRGLQNNIQDL